MSSRVDRPPSPRPTFFALVVLCACLLSLLVHGLAFDLGLAGLTVSGSAAVDLEGYDPVHAWDAVDAPFMLPWQVEQPESQPVHIPHAPAGLILYYQAAAPLLPPPKA